MSEDLSVDCALPGSHAQAMAASSTCTHRPLAATTALLALSLLVLGCLGCASGGAPEILVAGKEVVLADGDTLNITCRDTQPIAWCTDLMLTNEPFLESYEEGDPKPYISTLIIGNVNYNHVGFLSCLHNTTRNREEGICNINDPNVASIYLYVKDEQNLLTNEASQSVFTGKVGHPFVLPCKPTFPEVNVTIDKIMGSFNPYYGFTVVGYEPLDLYLCQGTYGGRDDIRHMVVNFVSQAQDSLHEPSVEVVVGAWQENEFVDDDKVHYDVKVNQAVNLSCEYDMTTNMRHEIQLFWNHPDNFRNETGSHKVYRIVRPRDNRKIRYYEITNATESDEGEYSCVAKLRGKKSKPGIIVLNIVHEDDIYLDLDIPHFNITEKEDFIKWEVEYHAHPLPVFRWYREEELLLDSSKMNMGDKRYEMNLTTEKGKLYLSIVNPGVMDIGEYTLEATLNRGVKEHLLKSKKMYFTMPVEPQNMEIKASNDQLMQPSDAMFRLTCKVNGYPKPDIHLQFKRCFGKGNCSNFAVQNFQGEVFNELKRGEDEDGAQTRVTRQAHWTGRAQVPGYYRCNAFNEYGPGHIAQHEFLVTDGRDTMRAVSVEVRVEGTWQVAGEHLIVVEGDKTALLCRANKMHASTYPRWKMIMGNVPNEWKNPVNETDTKLSYISEIDIHNLTMEEQNFRLSCADETENITVFVQVIPMSPPEWMNGEWPLQPVYQLPISGNLTLTCSAIGQPTPLITWYKDDKKLSDEKNHRHIRGERISFDFITVSDSGHYTCEAKSRVSIIKAETFIDVQDPMDDIVFYILSVVVILILVLVIFIGIFCRKIYQDRKRALDLQLKEQQMFNEGDPASLNPQISLDQQAELLPYNTKYEVPRDSIIFDKLLGAGAFGRVYRATAINLLPGQARTTVAVKMMKSRTDSAQLKALRSEVKIMIHIGRHINIVNLLGAHSKDLASKGELLLLVEYCKYGNILDYMHRHCKEFINQINSEDKIDSSITEMRMRQRSGSGSRGRTSRSLKYAHLSFNLNTVMYTPGIPPDPSNSEQEFLQSSAFPLHSPGIPSVDREVFRSRSISNSSNHMTSDMSAMTCESSSGESDGYINSRAVGAHHLSFCSKDLLCWAYQIAKGMEYLAFKKVLHGDLAARNVLLAEDNVVKISDFGLAKDIYKNENYKKKSDGPVPVKWLALECLQDGVFSTQSDVWSFGVVLWEIFSLGQVPYPGVEFDENFVAKLEKGVRLNQPRYSTYCLYRVMLDCWSSDPLDRPSFSDLECSLGEMLGDAKIQHYLELNQPYQDDNTESYFLDMLQSQDYTAKVQHASPNLDEEGYEMPFSPSPFGAAALPPIQLHNGVNNAPRLTPLQMEYLQQNSAMSSHSPNDGTYLSMNSPSHKSHDVFKFDQEAVTYIAQRDSEVMQETEVGDLNSINTNDLYLKMDSGPRTPKTPNPDHCEHSPGNLNLGDVSRTQRSHQQDEPDPSLVLSKSPIALRHKVAHQPSEKEKHDSGVYSPTATMQTNPSYMAMNSFLRTDENNYISKEDAHDLKKSAQPQYENFHTAKMSGSPVNRDYLGYNKTEDEYANLLPIGTSKDRTMSEASSGLGSIDEDSPPQSRENFNSLKSSFKENAIIEEPVVV